MVGLSAFGLVLLVFTIYNQAPPRILAGGATMFAAGGLGVVFLWLWLGNSRLLIATDGRIGVRGLLGRTKLWPTAEVGRVIELTVVYSRQSTPQKVLYVLSYDGQTLARLGVRQWGEAAIGEFVRATGRQLEVRDQPTAAREFRQEFPRAASWASVHPTFMGAVIAAVAIFAWSAIAITWDGGAGH
jgi:hypothetical protein